MRNSRPGRGAVEDKIVVEVPVSCKGMVGSIEALLAKVDGRIKSARQGGEALNYAEVELEIDECTAAVERAAHRCALAAVEVDAPRVEIGGKPHVKVGHGNGTYYSLAGPVQVPRALIARWVGETLRPSTRSACA